MLSHVGEEKRNSPMPGLKKASVPVLLVEVAVPVGMRQVSAASWSFWQ
jgi:hypothetical protein